MKYYLFNKVIGEIFETSFHLSMFIHKHLGTKPISSRKIIRSVHFCIFFTSYTLA